MRGYRCLALSVTPSAAALKQERSYNTAMISA